MTHRKSDQHDQHDQAQPVRTCIGCRRKASQSQMVRCAATADGAVVSRTAPGRGAWLCSAECFHRARHKRAFDRAWRSQVAFADLDRLFNSFEAALADMKNSSTVRESATRTVVPTKG